jgi:RNA polymerase sigma-70 factor (ECF subfamily)
MPDREVSRRRLEVVQGEAYGDWEAAYTDNVVAVYRLVYRQVGNRPDAEDLAEEVFLAALPRLRLPAPLHSVRAYLAATIRTVVADHWRRHYAMLPTVSYLDEIGGEALVQAEGEAGTRALRVLALLPERFRRILELRFLRGSSVREAASEMGVSVGNARVLQYRALRRAAEVAEEMDR